VQFPGDWKKREPPGAAKDATARIGDRLPLVGARRKARDARKMVIWHGRQHEGESVNRKCDKKTPGRGTRPCHEIIWEQQNRINAKPSSEDRGGGAKGRVDLHSFAEKIGRENGRNLQST